MYVCGPTVYGPPHLGHGRFSLVFDVLRRYLEWCGLEVTYVSNITDIDDKIINRANDEGRDWTEIAARCEAVWWAAMDAIGVDAARPTTPTPPTTSTQMVELDRRPHRRGATPTRPTTACTSRPAVGGRLRPAGPPVARVAAGRAPGSRSREQKRSPVDFALWKKAKPGEPSLAVAVG